MELDSKKKFNGSKKKKNELKTNGKMLLTFWTVLNPQYALTQQLAIHFDWCYLIF